VDKATSVGLLNSIINIDFVAHFNQNEKAARQAGERL